MDYIMAQFGGKIPPPWQTRPQSNPIQSSLLGQHPASATPIPNQQIVIGTAPQAPQYAPVQQSMIQPPGLGGLQSIPQPSIPQPHLAQHNIPQPICSSNLAQQGQPSIAQVSLPQPNICQGSSSLMGQPPLNSQNLSATNLVSHSQLVPSQMQQIQPQVTTVAYPTPRALAPPGSFSSQGAPVNLAANINSTMPNAGIVATGPPSGAGVNSGGTSQPPQKQRVFTGVITKLCNDFGFVDEDVFFQTSCVKGPAPKVGERVLVEASYNPNMPFKWNANRVQVIPGPMNSSTTPSTNNRASGPRESSRNVSFNAVPPPNFSSDNQSSSSFGGRSTLGPRSRSPRRDRRDDGKRGSRDRPEREEKEKDIKRESRKRSRSRDRSRSPARRRARVIPRYNVQVPKIMLHMKEANVLELRKRYSNLYVPSDVFLARPLWSDTFPAHRAFQFPRPVSFHIMNKEVEPVAENDAVYDPPDINHSYAAKVMLMAVPPLEDIYRRSCALSEDPSDAKSCFVHPTRLINFLVGLKGKNETMAIGGYWSPTLDGNNPDKDPNVLIQTAIRTCKALTGIDLAGCTTWYRFAEIYYRRGETTHKGRAVPARVETTVLFLPDVWNICPTKLEWDGLQQSYRLQLDRRLQTAAGGGQQQQQQPQQQQQAQQAQQAPQAQQQQHQLQQLEQEDQEEEDGEDKESSKKDPTHWASLDPKNMKVLELRSELDARILNSKGLKSQLIARLTKALKVEQEKEEQEREVAEKMETDESRKKDEEEKRKEEERKKKEEEDKKKEEEEKKRAEERERSLLEKRYSLPDQPMVVVHPSRTAKSGKFDCTTMSLSVLLDYRQEDNKEHSFEVSLFAELFNEMLMRDFAFRIFKSLVEAPDRTKDEKREKEKEKKDEKEEKEDDKKKKDEKDKDEDKEEKKVDKKNEKEETKEERETKKDEFEEDEEMEEEFEEEMDEEDSKDESKVIEKEKEKEGKDEKRRKDERRDSRDNRREKKDKRKMVTLDPHLLLSFVYFDQTHTGYIVDKDLEDIINILGLNLSRAQLKKLMSKVLSRDVLYYRKLTDISAEERSRLMRDSATTLDLEQLSKGNNHLLPIFSDPSSSSPEKASRKSPRNTSKEEPVFTSTGVVKYEGSLVDISKLMQQLERSEKARNDTEEKLKELQKELGSTKDEFKRLSEKSLKSSKEIKSLLSNLKTTEEELKKVVEDNTVYQRALNQIQGVIRPLVVGVDLDDDEANKEEVKVKLENSKNGYPE